MTHTAFEKGWTMMRIVISPSLAEKLNSVQFWSNNPDDLSIGINMFQIGGSTIASILTLEDRARAFNAARDVEQELSKKFPMLSTISLSDSH
jgi:hypothetical protein